jgi:hypothetical protein
VRNFLPAILVWTKGAIGGNRMVGAAAQRPYRMH